MVTILVLTYDILPDISGLSMQQTSRAMRQFQSISNATLSLLGPVGVAFAAEAREEREGFPGHGWRAIVTAEYELACVLRR